MIGALSGTIAAKNKNPILVMVGGIGYSVHVTTGFLGKSKLNKPVMLYTHTHVRDDALDLFGFETQEELGVFDHLLTVSGIGPKTALLVIDRGVSAVRAAILSADVDFFTNIPRLGKKNAQKIIIELKSKLGSLEDLNLSETETTEIADLRSALLSMGFDRKEIAGVVRSIDTKLSLNQKILSALKLLGKKS